MRLALGVEAEAEGVEAWSRKDYNCTILFPEEVIGTGIDCLNLPRNLVLTLEVTRLPDPPAHAILSTECLIDQSLVIERLLELLVLHTGLHFPLHHFKRPIDIV